MFRISTCPAYQTGYGHKQEQCITVVQNIHFLLPRETLVRAIVKVEPNRAQFSNVCIPRLILKKLCCCAPEASAQPSFHLQYRPA